jgi:hypothetical protein
MKEEEKRKQELNDEELNDVAGGGLNRINTHYK